MSLLIDRTLEAEYWLKRRGYEIPDDVQDELDALKTEAFYLRSLSAAIRKVFAGGDIGEFIDKQIYLIEEQFKRAWNEGMREVGFNARNQTAKDRQALQDRINAEFNHVLDFAAQIEKAAKEGKSPDPYINRAAMWAARYKEVKHQSMVRFGGKQALIWNVGPTEHCSTCAALDKVVASAEDWDRARARGIYPQSPDLECHGYNCRCSLSPTDAEYSRGGIPV